MDLGGGGGGPLKLRVAKPFPITPHDLRLQRKVFRILTEERTAKQQFTMYHPKWAYKNKEKEKKKLF